MSGGNELRFLIAAGTSRYENLEEEDQLPSVERDITTMIEVFCGELGYERVLEELGSSPAAGQLRDGLSEWLASEHRRVSDRVVIYYSGHGEIGPDGRHYLLARDFDGRNYVSRALATEELGRMLAATPLRHVLMIVDTCYSGEGITDLAALKRGIERSRHEGDELGAGLYLVAASRRREVAHQGAFSGLFAQAVHALPHGGLSQPHLDPGAVIGEVNARLRTEFPGQRAEIDVVGSAGGLSPLIPNPRYKPRLPDGLTVTSARRLLNRLDLLGHWGPRARGVELETMAGDFFEGRTAALRALVEWLSQDASDGPMRVVTGRPGSGKSALLARLTVLSDAQYRAHVDLSGAAPGSVPPVGAIDLAIHARGKTVSDIAEELAGELGCQTEVAFVIEAASARERPFVVLVDAVDEAINPRALAREALRPLAASGGLKLLIGARPHLLGTLAWSREAVIDLDQSEWFDPSDLERYAEHTLTAPAPDRHSPYADMPGLARQVARAIARRAGSTFLIARLVARALSERPDPIDISRPDWINRLPDTVADAFDEWLDRFGVHKQSIRDLLRPLAFAQGAGLPWETLWPVLATSIAGRPYGNSDIEWVLETAGDLIIEGRMHGRSVYRLFHEALAEHLRPADREATVHETITEVLVREVPWTDGKPDWHRAHPYLRTHLATHAAAGGVLDELLEDPTFLVSADPDGLLRALPAAHTRAARDARMAYRHAAHLCRNAPPGERASYLEMAARQVGSNSLAEKIAQSYPDRPWVTRWAAWRVSSEHVIVGWPGGLVVGAVALGELVGRPIAVSGSQDGTVRVWDLQTRAAHGEPLTGHTGPVIAVALGELDGRPIAVSGSHDGTVRVWDLADRARRGDPLSGHDGWVVVAVGELDGRPIAVSAASDGTVRVWDLADRRGPRRAAHGPRSRGDGRGGR